MMIDLFSQTSLTQPLADRMRPQQLSEYVGQEHLLSDQGPIGAALLQGRMHSMILWGPPGVGKTTLAQVISNSLGYAFIPISAVQSGVKELRQVVEQAQIRLTQQQPTLAFIDEIHRLNKAQQDALLPHVESGLITLIGATTENPSFEINRALLSRTRVYQLKPLSEHHLNIMLDRAMAELSEQYQVNLSLLADASAVLVRWVSGDGRQLFNQAEQLIDALVAREPQLRDKLFQQPKDLLQKGVHNKSDWPAYQVCIEHVHQYLGKKRPAFDKQGDLFYEFISALHKSIRGSNPDATLYWLARMLKGGVDPLYIGRRLIRMASEDIGNADPRALEITLNAVEAQERLGSPEGELSLAQAAVYLACAPKSNAVYQAFKQVMQDLDQLPDFDVPMHLRNAPTKLMKEMGYGKTYRYAHDEPYAYAAGETYLPDPIAQYRWYQPTAYGLEQKIQQRLAFYQALDRQAEDLESSSPENELPIKA